MISAAASAASHSANVQSISRSLSNACSLMNRSNRHSFRAESRLISRASRSIRNLAYATHARVRRGFIRSSVGVQAPVTTERPQQLAERIAPSAEHPLVLQVVQV